MPGGEGPSFQGNGGPRHLGLGVEGHLHTFPGGRIVNSIETSKRNLALVFRKCTLYPHLTVYENIALCLKLQHFNGDEKQKILSSAQNFSFENSIYKEPSELSREQLILSELGRVSVTNPDAVLMLDPLKGLDDELQCEIKKEISKLYFMLGTTFVYFTNDIRFDGGFGTNEVKLLSVCQ